MRATRTVVTNFGGSYEEGVWVLHTTHGLGWVGAALSNGQISVLDAAQLRPLRTLVHDGHITDLARASPHTLVSSGTDGAVCVFDTRQSACALRFVSSSSALSVSLGYDGVLAAVAGSNTISFHDLRHAGASMGAYHDAHTQEITQVRFHESSGLLVSGAEDGLVCVFDTTRPSEEAALQSVLNVGTPLRKANFFGEGVCCLTGSETLSVWHHDSAQRICEFGLDLRDRLSQLSHVPIEYLVDCHWDGQELSLLAGNASGEGALFRVEAGNISLRHTLEDGHRGVIRTWSHPSTGVFLTGGEDARLCEWNPSSSSSSSNNNNNNKKKSPRGGPVRRGKKKSFAAPY